MDTKPIYGYSQYPHMVSSWLHYPLMDIKQVIATNIAKWMTANPATDTLKKLAQRSGVSFGTVQRARNAEANMTIENLAMLADALGKTPADLVTPVEAQIDLPAPMRDYLLPSSNVQPAPFAAESRATYATGWPFPHADQQAYNALPPDGQLWVQGRLDAAIEQARQQFGTATGKRSA